jgi:hypothetical protein
VDPKRIPLTKRDIMLVQEASVFDKAYNEGRPVASTFWIGYLAGKRMVNPSSLVGADSVSVEYRDDFRKGYLTISINNNKKLRRRKSTKKRRG